MRIEMTSRSGKRRDQQEGNGMRTREQARSEIQPDDDEEEEEEEENEDLER